MSVVSHGNPEETEAALFYAVVQTAVTAHLDTKICVSELQNGGD